MLNKRCFLLTALFLSAAITCSSADSAVPALEPANTSGADLNRILEDLHKTRLDRQIKKDIEEAGKTEKAVPNEPAAEPAVPETRVTLKKIEFTRSSVLSSEKLEEFAAAYVNKEIGIAELKGFIGKINNWYKSNGYITALAALPPQEIKSGILKVVLIEGKIGNVRILGNSSTRTDFFRKRIGVPTGKLLDIRKLDRDLAWFNGTNDVKARIKLQAGEKPGTTDCYILAYEPEEKTFNLFSDTAGNKSTGEMRTGFSFSDASVTGNRDAFSLTSLMSKSSKAAMLGYSFPINTMGTKISLYHSLNSLQLENFGFDISGRSESTGFSLILPLKVSSRFKGELIFDANSQRSVNRILGVNFVEDREKRYSLGQSFLWLWPGKALYLRPTLTMCDYKGLAEQKRFQKYSLDGVWQKVNPGKQMMSLKLSAQKAQDEFMPSADQFFLGGLNTIRGYDESVISGDSGLNLKFDYQFPVRGIRNTNLYAFYDWGKTYGKSFLTTRMIHSMGFGFNHSFARDSQITLSVGYPIVKKIGTKDVDPQRIELTFSISL